MGKHLWQYKNWPDDENPGEIVEWNAGDKPNPCTIFRAKWLTQLRTWVDYALGLCEAGYQVTPYTAKDNMQVPASWPSVDGSRDRFLYSNQFAARANIEPANAEIQWPEPFKVEEVLHPYAPGDRLLAYLAAFRIGLEELKAVNWSSSGQAGHGGAPFREEEDEISIFSGQTVHHEWSYKWDPPDPDNYGILSFGRDGTTDDRMTGLVREWITGTKVQPHYNVAVVSELWDGGEGWTSPEMDSFGQNYCHEIFDSNADGGMVSQPIGYFDGQPGKGGWGMRTVEYYVLIDDYLPEDLVPPGDPILSPG